MLLGKAAGDASGGPSNSPGTGDITSSQSYGVNEERYKGLKGTLNIIKDNVYPFNKKNTLEYALKLLEQDQLEVIKVKEEEAARIRGEVPLEERGFRFSVEESGLSSQQANQLESLAVELTPKQTADLITSIDSSSSAALPDAKPDGVFISPEQRQQQQAGAQQPVAPTQQQKPQRVSGRGAEQSGASPRDALRIDPPTPQRFGAPGQQQVAGPEMPQQPLSTDAARRAAQEVVSDRINTQQVDLPEATTDVDTLRQAQLRQQRLQAEATAQILPQDRRSVPTQRMEAPSVPSGAMSTAPKPTVRGGSVQLDIPSKTFLQRNPYLGLRGAVGGMALEAYNKDTIQKIEEGDLKGAAQDAAKAGVVGAGIEAGAATLGLSRQLGQVAAPVAGAALFAEGREGSTTDYLLDKYGDKIGMNQTKPVWGTEFGEMNTQKPGYVQATEDAIDRVTDGTMQLVNGAIKFVLRGDGEAPQPAGTYRTCFFYTCSGVQIHTGRSSA